MVLSSTLVCAGPIIPGLDRLSDDATTPDSFAGEILLGELNCIQCHAVANDDTRIGSKTAPDLSSVGARVTPQYLRQFVTSPASAKSGTTMPNIFHSSDPTARDGAVDFLTHFLVSLGGPIAPSRHGDIDGSVSWGKELFHSIGCVACHGPQEGEAAASYKPLGDLATKTTVDALTEFLLNPHDVRPSGRMPSLWLDQAEARAISVYLLRDQRHNPQSSEGAPAVIPGLHVDYYELDSIETVADIPTANPTKQATVDTLTLDLPFESRPHNYGLRFSGQINIEKAATYEIASFSDDGIALLIDGQPIVKSGESGRQQSRGTIALEAGKHDFEVAYFNGSGDSALRVTWRINPNETRRRRGNPFSARIFTHSGGAPMVPLNSGPFTVDKNKAMTGKRMFQAMRCAACHQLDQAPPISTTKTLAQLDLSNDQGCLGNNIRRGLPDYQLSATQRRQLNAALQNRAALKQALSPAHQVKKTLATFNCYACHERDGIGGPAPDLAAAYFTSVGDIDLGEEGKIPPTLNHVGFKLKPDAIQSILGARDLHVRHYMTTRMPHFGAENLTPFTKNIAAADDQADEDRNPSFSTADAEIGRKFIGTTGLACVTCHQIKGQAALAIQGIDLVKTYERINPSWFQAFLLEPARFNKDTRMPQFWPEGDSPFTDILGGDAKKQITAIWSYLSLENSLTLPVGITPPGDVAMELTPTDTPIVHRTFMEDVGPRSILTGFPEKLSTAFDANVVRLAKAWRGRFFDHSGVESGRTYTFLSPLGDDVLDLPDGPAFAQLDALDSAWPSVEKTSRNIGGHFLGYTLDETRRPTFRYRLGKTIIEEKPEPLLRPGGAVLKRTFKIENNSEESLYFLAGEGSTIEDLGGYRYRIGDQVIHLTGTPSVRPLTRPANGQRQLIVPLTGQSISLSQTIEW